MSKTSRIAICLAALLATIASVRAQTGSAKSPSVLAAEVNSLWPDQNTGAITPFNARQTLLDIIASYNSVVGIVTVTGIVINPAANTTNQGVVVTQSSPASGTPTGPLAYNAINVANNVGPTTAGTTNGLLNASTRGLSVSLSDGATTGTNAMGALVQILNNQNATGHDQIALTANAFSNQTSSSGFLESIDAIAQLASGATEPNLTGVQIETAIPSGATATNRIGLQITNDSTGQASTYDTAIAVDNLTSGGQYKHLITLGSPTLTQPPIDTSGDLFFNNQTMTVANIFNMSTVTVTGSILSFPNASLSGSGQLSLGNIGSLAGLVKFANATSGTLTIQPAAGALGASVLTLPTATDTLVARATTDTLTNKTYDTAGSGNSLSIAGVNVATAWSAFTPSPSCGTATFTVNSARSKTLGKTTYIEFDLTITAIGTCTSPVTFTLPNTTNSPGAIGFLDVNTGVVGMCHFAAAATTTNCLHNAAAAFANNAELRGSGVYENQ
jgi:hypothetical protein